MFYFAARPNDFGIQPSTSAVNYTLVWSNTILSLKKVIDACLKNRHLLLNTKHALTMQSLESMWDSCPECTWISSRNYKKVNGQLIQKKIRKLCLEEQQTAYLSFIFRNVTHNVAQHQRKPGFWKAISAKIILLLHYIYLYRRKLLTFLLCIAKCIRYCAQEKIVIPYPCNKLPITDWNVLQFTKQTLLNCQVKCQFLYHLSNNDILVQGLKVLN